MKRINSKSHGRLPLMAGVALSAVVIANPALGQEANATDSDDQASEAAPQASGIVVTGSRIQNVTPFNSPDPIAIVSPEVAKKEGKLSLAEALQTSPIAAGSTQITSAISSNFVTNGGPGAQTVDLRGLGANRTLVLLNGRRAGPAGTRGGVSSFDLNVLPLSIINDIQILKTGASSVYGSDAVAGVVNIMTGRKDDGLTLNFNTSVPFDGGGEEYRISGSYTKTFDRGHFMIAGDYSRTNELARGDRDYLACPEAYIFDEAGNRADLIDPRTGKPHCEDLRWGHVWTYNLIDNMRLDGPGGPDTGIQTSPGGRTVLIQYQYADGPGGGVLNIPAYGAPSYEGDLGVPAGFFPTGYDAASMAVQNAYHPFVEEQTIVPETDLYTIYAEGAYEISDAVELFGEFLFNRRETYQNGWRQFWNFGWTGDLYGTGSPTDFNYWGAGWQGVNFISPTAITNLSDNSQKVDYYRGVAGLRGNLGGKGDWKYEVYGQYSKSVGRYRSQQILQDAYDSGYFQYSSCVGSTLPVSGKQCIDIPWADPEFLRGNLTQEQIDFLFDWEEGKTVYTQLTGEASVSGSLFDLPAGPVGVAMGVTARRDKINDTPGEITLAANAWGASASGITAGKSDTLEAFGELNVPLLADKPFFEELTLSAAGRVTNVKATRASDGVSDSDNGNWTYKLGLNWAVNDWLRFRGSYGTSFRAPALFEQFLADETSFQSQGRIDPCSNWAAGLAAGTTSQRVADNCAADGIPGNYAAGGVSATVISSGGLGVLEAGSSKAFVVGTILTPKLSFLGDTDLRIAVDYFNIKVEGEVDQLGAGQILFGCYNSEDFANEPLCDLFTRGQNATAIYQINEVFDKFVNIAQQKNSGIDVAVNLRHDFGNLGLLSLTADMTWQLKDDFVLLPGSPIESDNGEAGSPKWVGDFRATWSHDSGLSLFYGVNVIGATSNQRELEDAFGGPCINSFNRQDTASTADDLPIYGTYCPDVTASAKFYHNFSITQEIADGRFAITAGINNLFDTRPPRVSVLNGGQITMLGPVIAASQYGFAGRRGFVNVTAKF
ncbi:TonB-dependent receptor [Altererythrobacter sp. BO-6]|uniref:TonB-dependent receptor domain-containing protein n=1 Tax=Altererythrobacter sp. BO-6 TaxID=2604537 RepID=UPI0013E14C04|nr:TonB-dependent receptor [Altererythrobacter sp. BO-6]QIG54834.1 TonB-dependent receptor [Altererythrobacter sp. BO-6]